MREFSVEYNDPMMYGGTDPNRIEFPALPSQDPDENIPAAEGAPVQITGQYTGAEGFTGTTGDTYDPLTGGTYANTGSGLSPQISSFASGSRDEYGRSYNERVAAAKANLSAKGVKMNRAGLAKAKRIAEHGVPVTESGLRSFGDQPNEEITLLRGPAGATGAVAPNPISARIGYEFLAKRGTTEQQDLAAERLPEVMNTLAKLKTEEPQNLAPREGGR